MPKWWWSHEGDNGCIAFGFCPWRRCWLLNIGVGRIEEPEEGMICWRWWRTFYSPISISIAYTIRIGRTCYFRRLGRQI